MFVMRYCTYLYFYIVYWNIVKRPTTKFHGVQSCCNLFIKIGKMGAIVLQLQSRRPRVTVTICVTVLVRLGKVIMVASEFRPKYIKIEFKL